MMLTREESGLDCKREHRRISGRSSRSKRKAREATAGTVRTCVPEKVEGEKNNNNKIGYESE